MCVRPADCSVSWSDVLSARRCSRRVLCHCLRWPFRVWFMCHVTRNWCVVVWNHCLFPAIEKGVRGSRALTGWGFGGGGGWGSAGGQGFLVRSQMCLPVRHTS